MQESIDARSGSSALEMSSINDLSPDQASPSTACLNHYVSNQQFNKALPRPPTRFHYFRHSLLSLWYHRLNQLEGYHFGVLCCAAVAAVVLIINLILTIWAVSTYSIQNGLGTLYDGSCKKTATLTFWIHVAINILSTLLLGASNYSMQCLSSPTRNEIDKAHGQGIWLDIGVPSMRNLRRLSVSRIVLWWLLAISSLPLHLLYNSAVFSSLCTREFTYFVVSSEYLEGAPFQVSSDVSSDVPPVVQEYQDDQSLLQRLENKPCLEIYTAPSISTHSDLILISNYSNFENSLVYYNLGISRLDSNYNNLVSQGEAYDSDQDYFLNATFIAKPQSWSVQVHNDSSHSEDLIHIQYCLSKPEEEHCKFEFSLAIMIVVIICNMIKTICMGTIAWKRDTEPLVTLGDAIASFLDRYDSTTRGHCTKGKIWFENSRSWDQHPSTWDQNTMRWFRAASWRRWLMCNVLCFSTLIAAGALLGQGLNNNTTLQSRSIPYLWSLGFGNVSSETLIPINHRLDLSAASGLVVTVLIANSPQILLSFLYFTYNGIFTCMLVAEEWSAYGLKRNFLRVTTPRGRQRSTYRLQIPYRYGIPLLIASSILHWLVSQSIFLARVNVIDSQGIELPDAAISTCGYSPIAVISVIILGSLVLLVGIANGFRKGRVGMPLAGSCSAAISAACHPPEADTDASLKRVMWGVVADESLSSTGDKTGDSVGHCSFTSFDVEAPVVGKRYAGLPRR